MNQINWLEVFNSATTFGILSIIAIALVLLLIKRDLPSKPHSKQKSPKR